MKTLLKLLLLFTIVFTANSCKELQKEQSDYVTSTQRPLFIEIETTRWDGSEVDSRVLINTDNIILVEPSGNYLGVWRIMTSDDKSLRLNNSSTIFVKESGNEKFFQWLRKHTVFRDF